MRAWRATEDDPLEQGLKLRFSANAEKNVWVSKTSCNFLLRSHISCILKHFPLSEDELWMKQFGNEPLCGKMREQEREVLDRSTI